MNNKNTNRKGFTLVELVIVLAVVVIASGMVVTFSTMMHGAQGVSNARYEALQDVKVAESLIESFIENNANISIAEDYSNGGDKLCVMDGANEIGYVYFSHVNGGALVYILPGAGEAENDPVVYLKSIETIEFSETKSNDDTLYYCTIIYSVGEDNNFTYTFCVNPYVGE